MTARKPRYDLATERWDYPSWTGPPHRSLVICSHPRSGSTLLGEALHAIGGLGCPLEYLHRGFRPSFAERWNAPDLATYIGAMHRHRTDPSGVFSIKLFWRDIEELLVEQAGPGRDPVTEPTEILDRVRAILPDPTFVFLVRRDRVRQAVSAFIASETSAFRAIPGATSSADRDVTYDYEAILRQLAAADYGNARWLEFFAANRLDPYRMEYEALDSDYDRTVAGLLAHLGRPATPPPPRLVRQATSRSERFVLRFLTDHAREGGAG